MSSRWERKPVCQEEAGRLGGAKSAATPFGDSFSTRADLDDYLDRRTQASKHQLPICMFYDAKNRSKDFAEKIN